MVEENFKIWTPEWLKIGINNCRCNEFCCQHKSFKHIFQKWPFSSLIAIQVSQVYSSIGGHPVHFKFDIFWDFPEKEETKIIEAKYIFYGPTMPKPPTKKGFVFEDQNQQELFNLKLFDFY